MIHTGGAKSIISAIALVIYTTRFWFSAVDNGNTAINLCLLLVYHMFRHRWTDYVDDTVAATECNGTQMRNKISSESNKLASEWHFTVGVLKHETHAVHRRHT
jgi:hypothetical protein